MMIPRQCPCIKYLTKFCIMLWLNGPLPVKYKELKEMMGKFTFQVTF